MRPALLALLLASLPAWAGGASPLGEWWTPGFRARVAVAPCGEKLCAHIAWVWDPRGPAPGRRILWDLRPDANGGWSGGRAFNPDDGYTYAASARLLDADHLVIEGCVMFLCRDQVWLRVGATRVTPVAD